MDDQVMLWVQRDADGVERRCAVALIGEGEFELRVWKGATLILQEQFPFEAAMLDRVRACFRAGTSATHTCLDLHWQLA